VATVIDLHTHSTVSDGSEEPTAVVELAAEAGLTAVALTDHDRLDGLHAAAERAAEVGVELVPGCELSVEHPGTMHVLVYFLAEGFSPHDGGPLQDELAGLQQAREDRNGVLARKLQEIGLPITLEEMEEESGGTGTGRPHAAAVLVRKGVVTSVQEAFDRYLAKGKPGYVPKTRLAPADALRLARASGALPVLAHPLSLGVEPAELERQVGELAGLGLAGMECVYGRYTAEERRGLEDLAGRLGLAVTGGSDFHGSYKPDLAVGTGRGDLAVDDVLLAGLRERATAG
jgi:predicted metal-dependent phosphoesterase TrpH